MAALTMGIFLTAAVLNIYGYVQKTVYDVVQGGKSREKVYLSAEAFNRHIQEGQYINLDAAGQLLEIIGGLYDEKAVYKIEDNKFYINGTIIFEGVSGEITFNNRLACLCLSLDNGEHIELYGFKRAEDKP